MEFGMYLMIAASIVAKFVVSQSISASYLFLSGSPWTGVAKSPSFPSSYPWRYGGYSSSNTPGGRNSHRTIIYNGLIYSFHGKPSPRNDVWAFRIADKAWAWMAGLSNSGASNYGTMGVVSSSNTPGYRYDFGGDIHRIRGEYILFGGFTGFEYFGDLWTFDLTSNSWTWLAGQSSLNERPLYNDRGISTRFATPGGRYGRGCVVYPATGEFLLYGGYNGQHLSDTWAFTFNDMRWTWISGSSSPDVGASIGLKGEWSAGFFPGSRETFLDMALSSDTNIMYLFGGYGPIGYLNDLWAFKRNTLEWAWIGGSSTKNMRGICGTLGYSDINNYPGARYSHNMVYHQPSNFLILFGGYGLACNGVMTYLSDTWAFDLSLNEWAWIAGASNAGGSPSSYSILASQTDSGVAVDPDTSDIYMFGGTGYLSQSTKGSVDYVWSVSIRVSSVLRSSRSLGYSASTNIAFTSLSSLNRLATGTFSSSSSRQYKSTSSPSRSATLFSTPHATVETFAPSIQLNSAAKQFESIDSDVYSSSISLGTKLSSVDLIVSESLLSVNSDLPKSSLLEASTKRRTEQKKFKSNTSQNSSADLKMLWTMKVRILAALLMALFSVTICVIFHLTRSRAKRNESVNVVDPSRTTSEFHHSNSSNSSTTSNSNGQTTLPITTIGVYIPGGLLVDGTAAYKMIKEIARGGGGSVWLATALYPALKEYGETVIVKIPHAKEMNERAIALFHQEIALMNAFKYNQNIAKLLGFSENPHATILKYYPNGSLTKWITSGARTMAQLVSFGKDISTGISLLHASGVVHCDLKPDNILIDFKSRLVAVITDFGISRIVTDNLLKVGAYRVKVIKGASLAYAGPEVIDELRGRAAKMLPIETMSRDIYAIGMIFSSLLNGSSAWK